MSARWISSGSRCSAGEICRDALFESLAHDVENRLAKSRAISHHGAQERGRDAHELHGLARDHRGRSWPSEERRDLAHDVACDHERDGRSAPREPHPRGAREQHKQRPLRGTGLTQHLVGCAGLDDELSRELTELLGRQLAKQREHRQARRDGLAFGCTLRQKRQRALGRGHHGLLDGLEVCDGFVEQRRDGRGDGAERDVLGAIVWRRRRGAHGVDAGPDHRRWARRRGGSPWDVRPSGAKGRNRRSLRRHHGLRGALGQGGHGDAARGLWERGPHRRGHRGGARADGGGRQALAQDALGRGYLLGCPRGLRELTWPGKHRGRGDSGFGHHALGRAHARGARRCGAGDPAKMRPAAMGAADAGLLAAPGPGTPWAGGLGAGGGAGGGETVAALMGGGRLGTTRSRSEAGRTADSSATSSAASLAISTARSSSPPSIKWLTARRYQLAASERSPRPRKVSAVAISQAACSMGSSSSKSGEEDGDSAIGLTGFYRRITGNLQGNERVSRRATAGTRAR